MLRRSRFCRHDRKLELRFSLGAILPESLSNDLGHGTLLPKGRFTNPVVQVATQINRNLARSWVVGRYHDIADDITISARRQETVHGALAAVERYRGGHSPRGRSSAVRGARAGRVKVRWRCFDDGCSRVSGSCADARRASSGTVIERRDRPRLRPPVLTIDGEAARQSSHLTRQGRRFAHLRGH